MGPSQRVHHPGFIPLTPIFGGMLKLGTYLMHVHHVAGGSLDSAPYLAEESRFMRSIGMAAVRLISEVGVRS